jgi:hypothetical protein
VHVGNQGADIKRGDHVMCDEDPRSETMTLFPSLDLEVDESSQMLLAANKKIRPTWFSSTTSSTAYGTRAPLAPTGSSFREFPAGVIFRSDTVHRAKPYQTKEKAGNGRERPKREARTIDS